MARVLIRTCVSVAFAAVSASAIAGSDRWYVTPEQQGDCGAECYTPPIAWIDAADGKHAFGVTCDGVMIMGGSAMEVSEPPFSEVVMTIDGQSFGRFSVDNGLNDVYVSPTDPAAQSPKRILAVLESGGALSFRIAGRAPLELTLAGSKAAIRSVGKLCR